MSVSGKTAPVTKKLQIFPFCLVERSGKNDLFKLNDDLTLADASNVHDSNQTMYSVAVSNIVTDQADFFLAPFFFLLFALQNCPQPPVGDLEQYHFGVPSSM